MWGQFALAALPYVLSMFQDKPDAPGAPAPVTLTDRSDLENRLIDATLNPNNEIWVRAVERMSDDVNRALGRRGMLNSSIGMQLQNNMRAELAQKWLESLVNRQRDTLNTLTNRDRLQADLALGNSRAAYEHAMNDYERQVAANAAQVQGLSGLINAGLGAYNRSQMMDRLDRILARGSEPQFGIPGG